MAIANRAQGWAAAARSRLNESWQRLCAHSLLSWGDLTGAGGPLPDRIHASDPVILDADPERAHDLLRGVYAFAGDEIDVMDGTPWTVQPPSTAWAEHVHSFAWLDHLVAADPEITDMGAIPAHVRELIDGWLSEKGRWDPVAWRPHVTARRLIAWFVHSRMILDGADPVWRSALLRSIARQSRHLAGTAAWAGAGEPRMTAAIGLALTGICLDHGEKRTEKGLDLIVEEVNRQILPDGGHISRDPRTLLRILADLLALRHALSMQRIALPTPIQHALDRMFPMVRFFRHGDGDVAHFNGSASLDPERIDALLAWDETDGQPVRQATQSGFQRMMHGASTVLMDAGAPAPGVIGARAHAGCLSFEMSVGAQRLIVNCGMNESLNTDWRRALRSTAAHSTLSVDDASMCTFLASDPDALFTDGRVLSGPRMVTTDRRDTDEGTIIEATHDGYERRFGLVHRRRLFLNAEGTDLRGEDTLSAGNSRSAQAKARGRTFTLRFHLHPDVRAELAWDETDVSLSLPDVDPWLFRVQGGSLSLEDTAYVDRFGVLRGGQQIVVQGCVSELPVRVRWALKAVPAEAPEEIVEEDEMPARPEPDAARAESVTEVRPRTRPVKRAQDNPMRALTDPNTGLATADLESSDFVVEDDWPPITVADVKVLDPAD